MMRKYQVILKPEIDKLSAEISDEIDQFKTRIKEKVAKAAEASFKATPKQGSQSASAPGIQENYRN